MAGAKHLYGMHDLDTTWASLVRGAARTAWGVVTLEIGDDPNNHASQNFDEYAHYGISMMGRLNYSHHGRGTIPVPDRYDEFAVRCANFVRNSHGCTWWFIGNEPNIKGERPEGQTITPQNYARCYKMCYDAIKAVSSDHRVLTAAIAPYNDETGWCVDYWQDMLEEILLLGGTTDGLNLHTYSRGASPASIVSEAKMNFPYDSYYNGFRAYRDFLAATPRSLSHLQGYITETDQLEPWENRENGWVEAAYREIDEWNRTGGKQKIGNLCLYRWSIDDKWSISNKQAVINQFSQTLQRTNYLAPAVDLLPPVATAASVVVIAPAGANIRSGPGTNYAILGTAAEGTVMPLQGVSGDQTWYVVESAWGNGWVYAPLVTAVLAGDLPIIVNPAPPATTEAINRDWLVKAFSRVLAVDPLVAQAVLAVESAGRAFEGGLMIIRLETHILKEQVSQRAPDKVSQVNDHFRFGSPPWTGQEWRSAVNGPWQTLHDGGQQEEWAAFAVARKIDETSAMCSISMGSAQVMGFNHKASGYLTVQQMFNDYNNPTTGEFNQVAGFFAYVVKAGAVDEMQRKDWLGFARIYNGPGQSAYYAEAMETKYRELGGR